MRAAGNACASTEDRENVKYVSCFWGVTRRDLHRSRRFHTDEKSCYREQRYPYRKPTQVDEERILRRAGEALLRNSAN